MTKLQTILQTFAESGEALVLLLPFFGCIEGRIESLIDDVATVVTSDEQKVVLHYTQVAILRR